MYRRAIIILVALLIALLFVGNCGFKWQEYEPSWDEVKVWTIKTMEYDLDCAWRTRYDGLTCDWEGKRLR